MPSPGSEIDIERRCFPPKLAGPRLCVKERADRLARLQIGGQPVDRQRRERGQLAVGQQGLTGTIHLAEDAGLSKEGAGERGRIGRRRKRTTDHERLGKILGHELRGVELAKRLGRGLAHLRNDGKVRERARRVDPQIVWRR
ncbi:MAG: hypothetical protein ABIP77_08745, partial [Candidatus Limnocylindrales bacterium]